MSEFDAAGFSAIEKFFGDDVKEISAALGKGSKATPSSQHPKGKRRGVGSAAPTHEILFGDWTKKVLKVGRKRGRGGGDDNDEDVEGEGESQRQEDGEEEEGGRTAITPKEPSMKRGEALVNDDKLKQKIGRKERMKKQEEGKELENEGLKGNQPKNGSHEDSNASETILFQEEPSSTEEKVVKKHKRRKVRSKQKNIRKDNRKTKPDHLIIGKNKYQGRPLTAETRARLNLPEPKVRVSHFGQSPPDDELGGEGEGLAIDNLLEDSGEQVEKTLRGSIKQKAIKKTKKPRYKNLKV